MINQWDRSANKQAKATDIVSGEAYIRQMEQRQARSSTLTAKKLAQVFGFGERKMLTRRLYERLERGCQQNGPKYEKIVKDCARAAMSADNPAAYFSVAVTRRLRESGFQR